MISKIIQEVLGDVALSEEGRKWVYEAAELARKEGLNIREIEDYDWGTLVRFAMPDNPAEEADVFILYKQVHWLGASSFCSSIGTLFTTDKSEKMNQPFLETLAYWHKLIPGYEFDGHFNEFVKKVETKEDAIAEVKSIIPRVREVSRKLDDIKRKTEDLVESVAEIKTLFD